MNNSETYRKQCEARHVLTMGKTRRQDYYKGVLEKRGKAAKDELIKEVNRQYARREQEQGMEV